jgi:hypothetical protein
MRHIVLFTTALALAGCADASYESKSVNYATYASAPPPAAAARAAMAPGKAPADKAAADLPAGGEATKAATAGRKIIYNARVELVTEDLAGLEGRLRRLVEVSKGYYADSQVSGKTGAQRDATWKVRVPVEAYDSFLEGVKSLGELVSVRADSQDVSEEYYDVEARIKNKKIEEERLVKLLAEATGKLEEVLKVERELSRVREEIERFEGRLRVLANLTSLTTVTIAAREVHDYEPPQAPTFSTRIARTFAGSVDSLRRFGENAVLFVVGIVAWVAASLVVVIPLFLARRRIWRWLTTPLTSAKSS